MEKFKEILTGKDGYQFSVSFWLPKGNVKGIVQIMHGMVEYIDRYDDFASYLCSLGYAVAGDDHRGHGFTAGKENLGKVPDGNTYFDTVDDGAVLTDYLQSKYPGRPTVLFGHSYGSFLAQGYIEQYGDKLDGCILCGSAKMDTPDVRMGKKVANLQFKLYGKDKPAKLIKKLSFGGYDKPFRHEKRKNAWLNRDVDACEKYNNDKFCNYTLSIGFYKGFFDGLTKIYEKERLGAIPKDLPIFIISGDRDPVGNMGLLVQNLYDMYNDLGLKSVKIKLYNNARHEILNEINKSEVYQDVADWIEAALPPVKKEDKSTKAVADESAEKPKAKKSSVKKTPAEKSEVNGTESALKAEAGEQKKPAAKKSGVSAKSAKPVSSQNSQKEVKPAEAEAKETKPKAPAKTSEAQKTAKPSAKSGASKPKTAANGKTSAAKTSAAKKNSAEK